MVQNSLSDQHDVAQSKKLTTSDIICNVELPAIMGSNTVSTSYFNQPPQMAINGTPQLQMLQGGPSIQQLGNQEAAPHHTQLGGGPMWGSEPIPGASNHRLSPRSPQV